VPARIAVSDQVWSQLEGVIDEFGSGWHLRLLLRTTTDVLEAEQALLAAVLEVTELVHLEAGSEEQWGAPVDWDWVRVEGGLVIMVRGDDRGTWTLGAVCDRLTAHGVDGVLEVAEPASVRTPPMRAPMLACGLRVRGVRELVGGAYNWRPDREAYRSALRIGLEWSQGTSAALSAGTVGWVAVEDRESAHQVLYDAADADAMAAYAGIDSRGFRCVGVRPQGGVSIVSGVWQEQTLQWARVLDEMVELLRQASAATAYAFAVRGMDISDVLYGGEPSSADWQGRAHPRPNGAGWSSKAFDDLFAADAFGVQVFGSGYDDRALDSSSEWKVERLNSGARLVAHTDPAAWFTQPLFERSPRSRRGQPRPIPDVLQLARGQLDAFLYQPGRLVERGVPDDASGRLR
jgi:hypothetical protein